MCVFLSGSGSGCGFGVSNVHAHAQTRIMCFLCFSASGEFLNNERDPKKTPENMRLYAHNHTHTFALCACVRAGAIGERFMLETCV